MSGSSDCSDAEITPASEIRFIVGRNHQGQWVVEDRLGLLGGFFVSESAALHFALHEADHNPALVHIAPDDEIVKFCLTKEAFEGGYDKGCRLSRERYLLPGNTHAGLQENG